VADFTDTFNRAQDSAIGNGWTNGPSASFFIDANRAYDLSGGTGRYCYRTGAADMSVVVSGVRHTNGVSAVPPGGIVLRNDGSGNFIVARYQASSSQVSFMRWAGGVYTADIGSATGSVTIGTDDSWTAEAEGTTYRIYVNGVLKKTETYSNGTYNSNTGYGMYSESGSLRFDQLDYTALVTAVLACDRDNVLCGSGTVTVSLTGTNTSWAGSPFSLTGAPTGWSIASQNVLSGTSATVTLNKGSGTGAFTVTDGTASDTLTATNTATSVGAGDWDVAATWDVVDVPVSGNLAVVAHDVNVDSAAAVGSSPAEGNTVLTVNASVSLLVEAGQSLTVKGDVLCNGILQVGEASGGATLEFDASGASSPSSQQYRLLLNHAAATLKTRGTSGSHSVVRSNSGGGNAYTVNATGKGLWDCQWCDFLRVGDATNPAIDSANNTNPGSATTWIDLSDCTFTSCGRVNTSTSLPANAGASVVRTLFASGAHATDDLRLTGSTAGVGVTRLVNLCSFEKAFYWQEGAFAVTNSVLDGEGGGSANASTWAAGQFDGCFFRLLTTSGGGITGLGLRGDTTDCYFLADAGTDNPHILLPRDTGSAHTLSDSVVEYTRTTSGDAGNWFYGSGDWVVDSCIVLPGVNTASPGTITPLGSTALTFRVRHCTLYSPSYEGGVLIGDGGELAAQVAELTDSIFWHGTALSAVAVSAIGTATTTDNVVTPAGAVYNGFLNAAATRYQGDYPTTQPGANDSLQTGLPADYFVDSTRNIGTWAVSRGSASGTYADKVTDARTYLRADPTLVADLLAHVRAGFLVKYTPWRTASSTGTVLGAVQDALPGAVSVVAPTRRTRNRSLSRR
jgi:hypothetical protein